MFGRAAIRLGIGPHSSCIFLVKICIYFEKHSSKFETRFYSSLSVIGCRLRERDYSVFDVAF